MRELVNKVYCGYIDPILKKTESQLCTMLYGRYGGYTWREKKKSKRYFSLWPQSMGGVAWRIGKQRDRQSVVEPQVEEV